MQWWSWIVAGVVLLELELLVIDAQFFLVFIGLAAIVVGIAALAGMGGPEWVQWLLFAVLALIFTFGFRSRIYEKMRGSAPGFVARAERGQRDDRPGRQGADHPH